MGNCLSDSAIESTPSNLPTHPVPAPAPAQETASSAQPTSTSTSYKWAPKGPPARPRIPVHNTTQHDYEMIALSQDPTRAQRRRDDRDYLPPLSGSDSSFEEMGSHQHQHHGEQSLQLYRSMSMDTQGSRLDSPSRMTRMSSALSLGHGPQPTGTQFDSGLASGTSQIPAERQEHGSHFPSSLQSKLSNDFRFRILVAGKPRSGKSSLINVVFNVDMSRAPSNVSGITGEFRPRDNRRLIVHECSASGPGELQAIRDFITIRNHKSRPTSERLHAIWICIPMRDVVNRQIDHEGLKLLLNTGVPLVIVFTMFDEIVSNAPSHGNEYRTWKGHCRTLFGKVGAEIVSTQPKFRDLIDKLVATTDEVIISRNTSASEVQRSQSRMSPVTLAWSVSQRASRDINIQTAMQVGQTRYWSWLGSSNDFAGQTLASCVEVIHSDIVGVWNLPDKERYLSSTQFKDWIFHLIQDLSGPTGNPSRTRPNGTQGTGAAWLNERYEYRDEYICLVVAYIVDLTFILCNVFGYYGNLSPKDVQSAMNNFASPSSPRTIIHTEISNFFKTVDRFEYQKYDVVSTKIGDLIRQYCGSP